MSAFELLQGDCKQVLATLPAGSVQCCITSPPYWGLRDYGTADQLGLEATPEQYVANVVAVFREVWRVLRDDGTLWLNLGDSYTSGNRADRDPALVSLSSGLTNRSNGLDRARTPVGLKPKDLVGIPWRVAFALQADGWYLRQDIIWHKPNPMPESVTDRCTKAHEYIFLLTKQPKYYYDNEAVKEAGNYEPATRDKSAEGYTADYAFGDRFSSGARQYGVAGKRNKRSVWTVTTKPYKGAHFATFPPDLIEPCVLAGTSEKGCCEKCGKPWERVTIKDIEQPDGYGNMGANDGKWQGENKQSSGHRIQKNMNALRAAGRNHDNPFPTKTTTGWRSTCECGGEPVQCVVLDPFSGAGTTGVVAVQHGRRYIGIELNPEYLEMSRKRIQQAWEGITLPLFG